MYEAERAAAAASSSSSPSSSSSSSSPSSPYRVRFCVDTFNVVDVVEIAVKDVAFVPPSFAVTNARSNSVTGIPLSSSQEASLLAANSDKGR
jgi:hypothetical protein